MILDDASDDDPYRVLGLPVGASPDQIRKAYRKLAFRHHPDRNHGREAAAAAAFRRVQAAFERLEDPAYRAAREGEARAAKDARRAAPKPPPRTSPGRPTAPAGGVPAAAKAGARRKDVGAPRPPRSARGVSGASSGPTPPRRRRGLGGFLLSAAGIVFLTAARWIGAALLLLGGPTIASGALKLRLRRVLEAGPAFLPRWIDGARAVFTLALIFGWIVLPHGERLAYLTEPSRWLDRPAAAALLGVAALVAPLVAAERLLLAGVWLVRAEAADRVGSA